MSTISAGTTISTALVSAGDTTGALQLQVNGTTPSVTLAANGAIGVGSTPGYGTSRQVLTSAGSAAAPTWANPGLTLGTPVDTTTGTTVTFTGIPAGITTLIVYLTGVTNGSGGYYLTIGTSGGLETSGYYATNVRVTNNDTISAQNATANFPIGVSTTNVNTGSATLTLANSTTNTWVLSGAFYANQVNASGTLAVGSKSLSGVLDRVSFVSANTLTAGQVNIAYK